MSAVQFLCHFWPFNFTCGCIVCLAGPWIREPFLESCWDKNLGTATPHSSSDRQWQTKGHRDENRLHCAFKAWAAESDCSGGSGFVIFQREPLFSGSCVEAWALKLVHRRKWLVIFERLEQPWGWWYVPPQKLLKYNNYKLRCFSKSVCSTTLT